MGEDMHSSVNALSVLGVGIMFEKDLIPLSALRPSHHFHGGLVWIELLILHTSFNFKVDYIYSHFCLCVSCNLLFLSGSWVAGAYPS